MFIYRRIKTLILFLGVSFVSIAVSAQNHFLTAQKNILNNESMNYEIENCVAVVVLSKDRCSACTNSMPKMVKELGKMGFESSFAIVMDRPPMECKKDELYLLSVLDSPSIFFLQDKNISFQAVNDSVFKTIFVETTPALLLFSELGIEVVDSDFVMDDYGRVKKLTFISSPCKRKAEWISR